MIPLKNFHFRIYAICHILHTHIWAGIGILRVCANSLSRLVHKHALLSLTITGLFRMGQNGQFSTRPGRLNRAIG